MALTYPVEKYQKHFIVDKRIPNQTIETIFNLLYHPERSQFIRNIYKIRNDYDITQTIKKIRIPNGSEEYPLSTEYSYAFVHPAQKKMLLGPSKLNVNEDYNVIVTSPTQLYVEVTTKLSGFMLMDTFISRTLYIFEQISPNEVNLNVKYDIEFIKPNPFKGMVEKNGYEENEEEIKRTYICEIEKALSPPHKITNNSNMSTSLNSTYYIDSENDMSSSNENDTVEVDYCFYYYTF